MSHFDSWSVKDFNIFLSSSFAQPDQSGKVASTPTVLAGQMISGNVVFTVATEMKFHNFTFKLIGRESTRITVKGRSGKNHHTDNNDDRNFFKVHVTPLGMPKWGGQWQGSLAPGTYNFPFAVRLPLDALPSMFNSCGGDTSAVKYYVKAKFAVPFGADIEQVAPFNVLTAMPIAQYLTAAPYHSQATRTLRSCCCGCDRGYTNFTFSIDKHLIIFGKDKTLKGFITIDNSASQEPTSNITVSLDQQTTFTAQGSSRVAIRSLNRITIAANIQANQQGDQTLPFELQVASKPLFLKTFFPCNFTGELMQNRYLLSFTCNGDTLGQVALICASAVDESNAALPVQTDSIMGRTVPKAMYPCFVYAPPPDGMPQVPPQKSDIGPFVCQPPLAPLPYD